MYEENSILNDSFFQEKENYIKKIEKLKDDDFYLDIVFLTLCCFVDELSNLKYSNRSNKIKFKKILQEYINHDGNKFKLLDLLLLYQWEKNDYIKYEPSAKSYWRKLDEGKDLCEQVKIKLNYNENTIKNKGEIRYQHIDSIIDRLALNSDGEKKKYKDYLENFTNADVLYHFGRCTLVHKGGTLLLNERASQTGYESGHLITPYLLIKSLRDILNEMKKECEERRKMYWELREEE